MAPMHTCIVSTSSRSQVAVRTALTILFLQPAASFLPPNRYHRHTHWPRELQQQPCFSPRPLPPFFPPPSSLPPSLHSPPRPSLLLPASLRPPSLLPPFPLVPSFLPCFLPPCLSHLHSHRLRQLVGKQHAVGGGLHDMGCCDLAAPHSGVVEADVLSRAPAQACLKQRGSRVD